MSEKRVKELNKKRFLALLDIVNLYKAGKVQFCELLNRVELLLKSFEDISADKSDLFDIFSMLDQIAGVIASKGRIEQTFHEKRIIDNTVQKLNVATIALMKEYDKEQLNELLGCIVNCKPNDLLSLESFLQSVEAFKDYIACSSEFLSPVLKELDTIDSFYWIMRGEEAGTRSSVYKEEIVQSLQTMRSLITDYVSNQL